MIFMPMLLRGYTRIALLNLFFVAAIGFVLRYKIAYSLPFIDQKYLLHGHSHFAFTGWVTHTIMLLMLHYLVQQRVGADLRKYKWLINTNLISAYGMLVSFPLQGYGLFSIFFSTLSIFVAYAFAILYWKQLNRLPQKNISHWWMKAALLFNVISSLGAFSLAFMMATKNMHQHWYLAAVYFFLHFQYNGWFFFACMGLASARFMDGIPLSRQKIIFWLFAASCVPAYILSALWLPIPAWSYLIVVLAAFCQVAAWLLLLQDINKIIPALKKHTVPVIRSVFLLSGVACTIKLVLQLGSTIPSLATLAFGFRPVVIGYLHLILLGVITLFLLAFLMTEKLVFVTTRTLLAIKIFTAGVIINEGLLMIQGAAAIMYSTVTFINEGLLAAAAILLTGTLLLNSSQKSKRDFDHKNNH
jgi:hypothetical protein